MKIPFINNTTQRWISTCFMLATLISCSQIDNPHDISSTLFGHWETIDGNEKHYISESEITSYFVKEDRLSTYKYIILQQYPTKKAIEIRVQTQGNTDFKEINDRKLTFSDDYKFVDVQYRMDMSELLKQDDKNKSEYSQHVSWRYVDDKKKP